MVAYTSGSPTNLSFTKDLQSTMSRQGYLFLNSFYQIIGRRQMVRENGTT